MITIGKTKKEDIYEVKGLLSKVWTDTYKGVLTKKTIKKVTTIWHNPKLLESQCELENTLFIIAKEDNKKIVGLATATLIDDETLNLNRLYIEKEYQRSGIGSQLLKYIINEFPSARKVQLEVTMGNEKGTNFYIKNGFVEVSSKDEEIENEHIYLIVMERRI